MHNYFTDLLTPTIGTYSRPVFLCNVSGFFHKVYLKIN